MISIVCPVLNEEKYIANLLDFFLRIEPSDKELWIADGGSTDATRTILEEYSRQYPSIHWIANENKFVPYALNALIPLCKGTCIVRWDAHTLYAEDYLLQVQAAFESTGADIVGGPMRAIGQTSFQRAVAHATSTVLGVGNSSFHFENFEGITDSVYLGAWKKSVFEKIGLFDEQMHRNQDDEFHYRARQAGLVIYQKPSIKSWYYPRNTLKALFRQYFQYGLFKPLVIRKNRSEWKVRHLIPSFFVVYLILVPFLVRLFPAMLIPLMLYVLTALLFSIRAVGIKTKLWCLLIYPALHCAYGSGFLIGLSRKVHESQR